MLTDTDYVKDQTRNLWKCSFHDTEEFMNLYFAEKYSDEVNLTFQQDGIVAAAMQLLPYRMTLCGEPITVGYVSGLCTSEDYRKRGFASILLAEAHRRLYQTNATLALLIPGDFSLRDFYEEPRHGAYSTSSFRKMVRLQPVLSSCEDLVVSEVTIFETSLYTFYEERFSECPFMVHPSESDFFTALKAYKQEGGIVLCAHKQKHLVGICAGVMEEKGKCVVRMMAVDNESVEGTFAYYLSRHFHTDFVFRRIAVPAGVVGSVPYAMFRVVNVVTFLRLIALKYPDRQFHIGVVEDEDIPENNGYYLVRNGHVEKTDKKGTQTVTPGGLAAMFLEVVPVPVEMMLDE